MAILFFMFLIIIMISVAFGIRYFNVNHDVICLCTAYNYIHFSIVSIFLWFTNVARMYADFDLDI